MRQKRKRTPREPHGAVGSLHPARQFEWIGPDETRSLIAAAGGGMHVFMVDLTTRENIIGMATDLHYVVSGWLGWWQRCGEPVTCLLCEAEAAPYEGLPPAVVVMRLNPRRVASAVGADPGADSEIEVPVLVHGMCAVCAARSDSQKVVCAHIQSTLFPDSIEIDPLHLMPVGGRA